MTTSAKTTSANDRSLAETPEDLARLFNERANAGDVEGLVALYEPGAVLAAGKVVATGHAEIRAFYTDLLGRRSDFPAAETLPAIVNGDLAMTFARLPNGTISAETARRQSQGGWLWLIDQLKIKPATADKAG
ncbi:nuclear transport factor 2 family protein [Methylobacterium sp. J-078]|uniref:YybH family protein n=1 Tax=Methylobacterium sp. J-078 TaxID=2836657 RepID=UPI001FBB82A7|nr:nuclear transport factor 2 family protein [Methylobacterium sp. J-078]MCJ2044429.1 nuclear transport factor 2 family protein [Methylobacterium sp. J-078]